MGLNPARGQGAPRDQYTQDGRRAVETSSQQEINAWLKEPPGQRGTDTTL